MERPSSRAGMHPEKERRSQMNGGGSSSSSSKHKSKSPLKNSLPNWLNNNNNNNHSSSKKAPYLDRSYSYHDSYMGPHNSYVGIDPLAHTRTIAHTYIPSFHPMYPVESTYHAGEPASLPVYPLSTWAAPKSRSRPWAPAPAWDVWSSAYAPAIPRDFSASVNNQGLTSQEEEDFASLPPIFNDVKTTGASSMRSRQRRFSDPGVVATGSQQGTSSSASSSGEEGSTTDVAAQTGLVQRLLLEMSALRDTNQRLYRELDDTRAQLEATRAQQSNWRRLGPDYQPGMLADMVREVREASRIREEAMMSRLRLASGALSADFNDGLRLPMDAQGQLHRSDRRRASEPSRFYPQPHQNHASPQQIRVEERRRRKHRHHQQQLETSRASQQGSVRGDAESSGDEAASSVSGMSGSVSSPATANHTPAGVLADQVSQLRREKQQLSGELRQALDSRTEAEAHAQKLERLVNILRKKITTMNGIDQHTATELSGPVSLASVPESLTSATSSDSSLEPNVANNTMPQVLIHGPVTNL